ncbi:MAG: lytic transglycosylase domain-containing protein [Myxococcales bacterium]|nr:lytic transglycosylase domain-containing protein [Myxococcales bacterium]
MAGWAAAVLLLLPGVASADMYRYVDEKGVEHYTNVQPTRHGWQRIYRGEGGARKGRARKGAPDPARLTRYDAHLSEAARVYQLPEAFLRAVMRVESNFYVDAISAKGAMGLMQLMPRTAQAMGVVDPLDPRQNVLGGARYLRVLANRYGGDLVLTVAAYNAGPGAVDKYSGVPPYTETRRYVRRVLTHYYSYRSAERAPVAQR